MRQPRRHPHPAAGRQLGLLLPQPQVQPPAEHPDQELLTNPKTLLEHELGITIPDGVTIQVHEDTSTTVHLVLPQGTPSGELRGLDVAELERLYPTAQTDIGCTQTCETTNRTYWPTYCCEP